MAEQRRAFITGITGQDGSYLAELLLGKGYEVYGLIRRSSSFNTARLDSIYEDIHESNHKLTLIYGDVTDGSALARTMRQIRPDEVYNLAAQSHVRVSFDIPEYTVDTVFMGTLRLLEAIRDCGWPVRFYQASSSEMFGDVLETPQRETTPFNPQSPYGVAKVAAHQLTRNYRDAYDLFASCGILFNHESPRRGATFVTRKITQGLARIKLGIQEKLYMGNLDAKRDWGFSGDYVEGMWRMLQHDKPGDYVLATGETHTVREFFDVAGELLDMDWEKYVEIDPRYYRPTEVDLLLGDSTKALKELGWKPKVTFRGLVEMMVKVDWDMIQRSEDNSDGTQKGR